MLAGHDQRSDLLLFHDVEGTGSEFMGSNGFGTFRHAVPSSQAKNVMPFFEEAAEVAVTDDAEQAVFGDYGSKPQAFTRHFVGHVGHLGVAKDSGNGVAVVHELGD